LLPSEEVAIALKQKIRQLCYTQVEAASASGKDESPASFPYVVDVFAQAARKYSLDARTRERGGLVGELLPQGSCRDPVLDRSCFHVALGLLVGPIATAQGFHLLLVQERTNCPKLDGRCTKLVPCAEHGLGKVVPSPQVGQVDVGKLLADALLFFLGSLLAGGVVAELAASLGSPSLPPAL
jgi:hypothetical protein